MSIKGVSKGIFELNNMFAKGENEITKAIVEAESYGLEGLGTGRLDCGIPDGDSYNYFLSNFNLPCFWNKYIATLDDRFESFENLKEIELNPFPVALTRIPKVKELPVLLDIKHESIKSVKTVLIHQKDYLNDSFKEITHEWVFFDLFEVIDDNGKTGYISWSYNLIDYIRIIYKVFKGKELSVDEAVAELKEIMGDENGKR